MAEYGQQGVLDYVWPFIGRPCERCVESSLCSTADLGRSNYINQVLIKYVDQHIIVARVAIIN